MNNGNKLMVGGLIIILLGGMAIGYIIKPCDCDTGGYERKLIAFNLRNANKSQVDNATFEANIKGDWVCVNIKGMEYKRAVELVNHEIAHEIFANKCVENMDLCFDLVKELENE